MDRLVTDPRFFPELIPELDPFRLPEMIDHLVIGDGKKVALTLFARYTLSVLPEFFECRLYDIPCVLLLFQILQDEAIHVVRKKSNAFVVFCLCHKQTIDRTPVRQ